MSMGVILMKLFKEVAYLVTRASQLGAESKILQHDAAVDISKSEGLLVRDQRVELIVLLHVP
jgi:hypothetical protein